MGLRDTLRDMAWKFLGIDGQGFVAQERDRMMSMALNSDYYYGYHRPQFKRRVGQPDDNIFLNFTKTVVDRSAHLLLGNGVNFSVGDEESAEQEYLEAVYEANGKDVLFQKLANLGGIYGTCYVKIIPDGVEFQGKFYPRLVPLNPLHWVVVTEQEDIGHVIRYIGRFTIIDVDGQEAARKETIEAQYSADGDVVSWLIKNQIWRQGRWETYLDDVVWEYPYPPVVHWQNLPNPLDVYGYPDIDDNVIQLQDRINFVASNMSKIIRYHAHPKTWLKGGTLGNQTSWGADQLITLQGDNALLQNLEMQSDLSASLEYLRELRQTLFDITQTVDITSISDKIGALTNFGLRVLYLDAMAKLGMKQEVWGESLKELNRRILALGGYETDGGVVVWEETLPTNETEQAAADKFELDYKLVSKETISKRRGYEWAEEQERIAAEAAQGDNVGAAILRAFNNGNQ